MSRISYAAWDVDDIDTIYDVTYEALSACPHCSFPLDPLPLDVYHVGPASAQMFEPSPHQVYTLHFCPKCRTLSMCRYTAVPHPDQADHLDCTCLEELIPAPQGALSVSAALSHHESAVPLAR